MKRSLTIILITLLLCTLNCATSNNGPDYKYLHANGQKLQDPDGNDVFLKTICFNHFFEYYYLGQSENLTDADFVQILGWAHSADDYARVKSWGINHVRLYISPPHLNVPGAWEDLKNQVNWAEQNQIYISLAYFAPPSSNEDAGYYSSATFWQDINQGNGKLNQNSRVLNEYLGHWQKISTQFKEYQYVIYELINEPQLLDDYEDFRFDYKTRTSISPTTMDESLYINLMTKVIQSIRNNGDDHLIIVNGLNYAVVEPRFYRFIEKLKDIDDNILYSFHYYHPMDFVWQGCSWDSPSCVRFNDSTSRFSQNNPGWINIKFNFTTADFSGLTENPVLVITSSGQSGNYYVDQISITDEDSNGQIFFEDFSNINQIDNAIYDHNNQMIWKTKYGGLDDTAKNSRVYLEEKQGKTYLVLSNTVNQSTEGNWANASYEPDSGSKINLRAGHNYVLELKLMAKNLTSYGEINIQLMPADDTYNIVWTKRIRRYQEWDGPELAAYRLDSDTNMLQADFEQIVNQVGKKYNVPLYLGEFGVPECNKSKTDSLNYLRQINTLTRQTGIVGWALHNYRENFDNHSLCGSQNNIPCGKYRTFGLYSGWGKTVSEMEIFGLGTDINRSLYYYRPDLITEIQNLN